MFLFASILVSYVSACNVVDGLSPDCNNAGYCLARRRENECKCCTADDSRCSDAGWSCDPENPWECMPYTGDTCKIVIDYKYVLIGVRVVTGHGQAQEVTCSTVPSLDRSNYTYGAPNYNFSRQMNYVVNKLGWPGTVKSWDSCNTCTAEVPCVQGIEVGVVADTGVALIFSANLDEFYGPSCEADFINPLSEVIPSCAQNYDYGLRAEAEWSKISAEDIQSELNKLIKEDPTASNNFTGLGLLHAEVIGLRLNTYQDTETVTIPTPAPTFNPTDPPTLAPSDPPTLAPTSLCAPYVNDVENMAFLGTGADCRAGLDESLPGNRSCDSPYIVCLPRENTPGLFGGIPYKSNDYRYSVAECLQECANDQRCLGTEFVSDPNSSLGDCNLIDDIPIEITSSISGFTYDPEKDYENLDNSVTRGNAMCFVKEDCFPYFEAEELNDVMLNECYCPNNRKGFYTKRVKRTVDNTRFCGEDEDVKLRVRKAQANRMFHLCENWCLFETENPESESWYWDPWKTCWREQYGNVSGHMSYCSRVIINPDTIEMQFVKHRSDKLCK